MVKISFPKLDWGVRERGWSSGTAIVLYGGGDSLFYEDNPDGWGSFAGRSILISLYVVWMDM